MKENRKRAKAVRHMNIGELSALRNPFDDLLTGVVSRENSIKDRQNGYALVVINDILGGRSYSKLTREDIVEKFDLNVRPIGDLMLKEFLLEAFNTPIIKVNRGDKEFLGEFMAKRLNSEYRFISGLCVGEVLWYLSTLLSARLGGPIRFWIELFFRNCAVTRYGKHSYRDLMNRISVNELITGYGFGIFGLKRDGTMVHIPGFEKQLTTFFTIKEASYQQKCRKKG